MACVIDTNLHSMQVTVPHRVFGECSYFMPELLSKWLYEHGIENYGMCSQESWGNGYTDGVTNKTTVYMVRNIVPEDASAFKIQFPGCGIHVCQQYAYD